MTAKERMRQKVEDTILKNILTKYLLIVRMSGKRTCYVRLLASFHIVPSADDRTFPREEV